jgi:hypothetical protein
MIETPVASRVGQPAREKLKINIFSKAKEGFSIMVSLAICVILILPGCRLDLGVAWMLLVDH